MNGESAASSTKARPRATIDIIRDNCPCCDAGEPTHLVTELKDIESGVPGTYDISQCTSCGLIYLSKRPTSASLPACYDEHYHVRCNRNVQRWKSLLFDIRYNLRFRRLTAYLGRKPRKVLEIGCGDAAFLVYLEQVLGRGCQLVGIDLDVDAVELPKDSAIRLCSGAIQELELGEQFELVILYDVLEHLDKPIETLRRIAKLLTPDGLVVAMAPNWDSVWRKVFPRHWGGLQIPRHLLFFEEKTLSVLLDKADFKVRRISRVFDPGDLSVAICNWIVDRFGLKLKPRKAWFYYPILLISAPLVLLQVLVFRQSGAIEVVGGKRANLDNAP
jgi:SAM-dependent methyltransferase